MSWVWENSQSEPTDRLVLLAIADCANDDGAEAYPSMAKLASKTGLHERSIQRALQRLVSIKELVVHPNAGPRGCNRYRVTMTTPGTAPPPAQRRGGTRTPRQPATPAESHLDPGTAPPPPRQAATPTPGTAPPEPSFNHPLPVSEPSLAATAQTIVGEWIDRCAKRPPKTVIGQIAKRVAGLLDEGIHPDDVRRGLAQWMTKDDVHPSVLDSIVNGLMNARAAPKGQRQHNGLMLNDRTIADLARRDRLAALEAQQQQLEG